MSAAAPERIVMADKPRGWNRFAALAKRIVAVPKEKVEARIAQKRRESTTRPPKK
jgi:type IV secretory pathway protease TraF